MTTQEQATKALKILADMIVDSVREADHGMGVPAGPMYAAMNAHGCSLELFNRIMDGLVTAGKLTRSGHLYRVCARQWRKPR